jgi:hypothetical protein
VTAVGGWLIRTDPATGRQTLGRVFADGTAYEPRRPEPQQPSLPSHAFVARTTGEPVGRDDDILARIDRALAAAEAQQPDWHAEREDAEGFVTWHGGADAADSTRCDLQSVARRITAPIGSRQREGLRYVMHHPGCSVAQAIGRRHGYGRCYTASIWGLYHRGLIDMDTTRRNRYRLTITEAGIAELRANAARYGWVTGDPL